MNAFDRIIGYSSIKQELMQISDTLKNKDVYEALGVSTPKGLLLYGEPGVGKSLMASTVIEDSGLPAFILRKDLPNGDFVKEIKTVFEKAAENAPSIVYLDDMDKFANGDERYPDAEEYVTVQSCIDELKGKRVFVIATANNIRGLPRSLRRVGRFDRHIEVGVPHGKDAERIIDYYLNGKKFTDGMDAKAIARLMDGRTCAELETVINDAGLYAGYERAETITMGHFTDAYLRTIYGVSAVDDDYGDDDCDDGKREEKQEISLSDPNKISSQIAYHEAGHAVVSEVLCPESVTLVSAHNRGESVGGFTCYYHDRSYMPLYWSQSRIVCTLGGAAAVEQKYGIFGYGCESDFDLACGRTKRLVVNKCVCGFRLHQDPVDNSERLLAEQEQAVSAEVEKYYRKAKEIISRNWDFFEKTAVALAKKKLLSAADIKQIKSECDITPVSL